MDVSMFITSASTRSLQQQSSPSKPDSGTSHPDVPHPEVLNSVAAKEIYSHLSENDIRFVVLQAGEPTDPIECTLTVSHLDALPKYEALSYVWGSQANPKAIRLNGEVFYVTKNLHQALIRFRKPAESRLIWIDALAINQCDNLERNAQVRKMSAIYKRASTVLAWIGQDDEDLGEPTNSWRSMQDPKIPEWNYIFGQVDDRDLLQLWWSFKWLNRYGFWSRAWIIQEITHSNAVFILGPYEATYTHLSRTWFQLTAKLYCLYDAQAGENPEDCFLSAGSRLSAIMLATTRIVEQDGMLNLDSWLNSFVLKHQPRCLDPRDIIYAFYSLFTPEIQDKISIDYNMPIADLFALMTRVCIEITGNLLLLSLIDMSSRYYSTSPTLDTMLPTWAFNFAGEISTSLRWHKSICDKGVTDGKRSLFYHRFEKSDRSLLHVKGVYIGQVQNVDRSPRHKLFLGVSLELSKLCLGVTSDEEFTHLLAFLRTFAEPEDFSSLLHYDRDSMKASERKYWTKSSTALNTHFERLMFSYIPKHSRGQSDDRGSNRQFALGCPGALPGDKLCLILGCPIPLLLRQTSNSYEVVGSAYAQGYMEGEAIDALGIDIDDLDDFCLC